MNLSQVCYSSSGPTAMEIPSFWGEPSKKIAQEVMDGTYDASSPAKKNVLKAMGRFLQNSQDPSHFALKRKFEDYLTDEKTQSSSPGSSSAPFDPTWNTTSEKATAEQLKLAAATKLSKFKPYLPVLAAHKTFQIVQSFHLDDILGSSDVTNRPIKLTLVDYNEAPYEVYYGLCFPRHGSNNFAVLRNAKAASNICAKNFSLMNWNGIYDSKNLYKLCKDDFLCEKDFNYYNIDVSMCDMHISAEPVMNWKLSLKDLYKFKTQNIVQSTIELLAATSTFNKDELNKYASLMVKDHSADILAEVRILIIKHQEICLKLAEKQTPEITIQIRNYFIAFEPILVIYVEDDASFDIIYK